MSTLFHSSADINASTASLIISTPIYNWAAALCLPTSTSIGPAVWATSKLKNRHKIYFSHGSIFEQISYQLLYRNLRIWLPILQLWSKLWPLLWNYWYWNGWLEIKPAIKVNKSYIFRAYSFLTFKVTIHSSFIFSCFFPLSSLWQKHIHTWAVGKRGKMLGFGLKIDPTILAVF